MAGPLYFDRCKETTTTTGTGTVTLAGAVQGYQSLGSRLVDGDTLYYTIEEVLGPGWEVGQGTIGGSGTTLARNVVLESSNADGLVSFPAGTKNVWLDLPADRLTAVLGAQTANKVWAGPGSGGAAVPAFRMLVAADLPAGTGTVSSITAGTGLTGGTITTSGTIALDVPVSVAHGGTGDTSLTAYAVLCGGTTSTSPVQSVASVGTSGQVLTSNGAGALPTFQAASGAVSSVSNSDGTLIISPTTGAVVASLALGHANTWVAQQTFTVAAPTAPAGGANNERWGAGALASVTTGYENVAVGSATLASDTTGYQNIAVGYFALNSCTLGHENIAIGAHACQSVTMGDNNIALGTLALAAVSSGGDNVGVGSEALRNCTTGTNNSALGINALFALTTGLFNVQVGFMQGGGTLATGSGNTLLGVNTDVATAATANGVSLGYQAVCTSNECAFGPNLNVQTGYVFSSMSTLRPRADFTDSNVDNTDATRKYRRVAHIYDTVAREAWRIESDGTQALIGLFGAVNSSYRLTVSGTGVYTAVQTYGAGLITSPFGSGSNCEAFGANAGHSSATGSNNLAFGSGALNMVTSGADNVAEGFNSLNALTTGTGNLAEGSHSLEHCTTGSSNVAFGSNALATLTTGGNNVALGQAALQTSLADSNNLAIGSTALQATNGGGNNTAIGTSAMFSNTSGNNNTAIGSVCLYSNTNGAGNTGIGYNCLQGATSQYNVAMGFNAGYHVTSGQQNVLIGNRSGFDGTLATGSFNTLLGNETDTATAGSQYGVALGYGAVCASNELATGPNISFFSFFGQGSYGSGTGVAFLKDASVNPTTNPTGGGILFSSAGALHWRGSSGTDTTIAPAEPYCPTCGKDFVTEWKNEKFGHLLLCMWCLTEGMTKGVVKREAA